MGLKPLLLSALLVLTACGEDEPSRGGGSPATGSTVPAWAHVSKEQVAEAERLKLPVAFENSIGMRFVLIPAGTFTMGSPAGEEWRSNKETQHEVTISKACFVSIWETTNAQFRQLRPDHRSGPLGDEALNEDDHPVVLVSHDDATAFVAWLNGQDRSHEYRLPTEAEWEYASRAGTTTPFSFGETISTEQANFDGSKAYGKGTRGIWRQKTTPVDSFPASAWGIHDMHGNAWEWCTDWYAPYPSGAGTDAVGPASGSARVLRGGSWRDTPWLIRAARRDWDSPDFRIDDIGFRVVASLRAP